MSQSSPETERVRHQVASAIDSLTVAALADVFNPRTSSLSKSYSEQIVDILMPRLSGLAPTAEVLLRCAACGTLNSFEPSEIAPMAARPWYEAMADRVLQLKIGGANNLSCDAVLGLIAFVRDGEGSVADTSTDRNVNPVCDTQALLEIRDFLQDIVGGAEITERSRDAATGFVSILDSEFGSAWSSVTSPESDPDAERTRLSNERKRLSRWGIGQ